MQSPRLRNRSLDFLGGESLCQGISARVHSFQESTISLNISPRSDWRTLSGPSYVPLIEYRNNPDTIYVIKDALDKNQSVIAVGNEKALQVGLNPNYSFNVLKCDPKTGLEMRNSWGSIEERSKLNTSGDGSFSMSLQQCRDFLNHVIIARINDEFHSSVIRGKHKPGFSGSYAFTVSAHTLGTLSISQIDERMFPIDSGYAYSPIRIIVEKRTDNSSIFINGSIFLDYLVLSLIHI